MKEHEIYSTLRAVAPTFVRADGRNFRKTLNTLLLTKPYDMQFAKVMGDASELLIRASDLSPVLAFTFSDEVSALFLELPFNGRVEKLDSVVASYMSSVLTRQMHVARPISFDCRVVPVSIDDVAAYLAWRQGEAWRNHVNSYGHYCLRKAGLTARQANEKMRKMSASDVHELVFAHGVNLAKTPAWQRRGILVYKEAYHKVGHDSITQQEVSAVRTRIVQNWEVPVFASPEGNALVNTILSKHINKY